jgi:UDP-galactopyranose mutase
MPARDRYLEPMKLGIVGCGWAGAACARTLSDAGVAVEVFEAADVVGGHSRSEVLNGVFYEPNGAHIFHTNDEEVAALVKRFGVGRAYEHRVLARVQPDDRDEPVLLSWPPQVEELRRLPIWPRIESDLNGRPPRPVGDDLETYAITLMGPTLYNLFVRGYSMKQWGCDPRRLSSSFAPSRLDLRHDGDRRLFRDRYQFFEAEGFNAVIERLAAAATVHTGTRLVLDDVVAYGSTFDAWVVTAALDELVPGSSPLAWRGIEMRVRYHPVASPGDTMTPAYVVNHPDLRYPYTRTVESKHATGQQINASVVCEEYPGGPARHYPVPIIGGHDERRNEELMRQIRAACPVPVEFCGRLATYRYINQDEAIRQGIDCARRRLTEY